MIDSVVGNSDLSEPTRCGRCGRTVVMMGAWVNDKSDWNISAPVPVCSTCLTMQECELIEFAKQGQEARR